MPTPTLTFAPSQRKAQSSCLACLQLLLAPCVLRGPTDDEGAGQVWCGQNHSAGKLPPQLPDEQERSLDHAGLHLRSLCHSTHRRLTAGPVRARESRRLETGSTEASARVTATTIESSLPGGRTTGGACRRTGQRAGGGLPDIAYARLPLVHHSRVSVPASISANSLGQQFFRMCFCTEKPYERWRCLLTC